MLHAHWMKLDLQVVVSAGPCAWKGALIFLGNAFIPQCQALWG